MSAGGDDDTSARVADYELTFSPGHFASGRQINPRASRNELQLRLTKRVKAPSPYDAIDHFEREEDRMVTACRRVAEIADQHRICDECETVRHCSANGCITPVRVRFIGRAGTASAALALISGGEPLRSGEAAGPALPVGLEGLTSGQVQERFAAQGVEVTPDFALQLQVDAVQKLEDRKSAVELHDEHAATAVDADDFSIHRRSVDAQAPCTRLQLAEGGES